MAFILTSELLQQLRRLIHVTPAQADHITREPAVRRSEVVGADYIPDVLGRLVMLFLWPSNNYLTTFDTYITWCGPRLCGPIGWVGVRWTNKLLSRLLKTLWRTRLRSHCTRYWPPWMGTWPSFHSYSCGIWVIQIFGWIMIDTTVEPKVPESPVETPSVPEVEEPST